MKVWISGEIEADIAEDYRRTRNVVEEQINVYLNSISLETHTVKWAVIPIVRETDHPDYEEIAIHHQKRKVLEFRIKIPHALFKRSDREQRLLLLINCLGVSVDRMPQFGLSKNDQDSLRRLLDRTAITLIENGNS